MKKMNKIYEAPKAEMIEMAGGTIGGGGDDDE